MGKRIFRINKPEIEKSLSGLIGLELNIIMADQQVYRGRIKGMHDKKAYFVDNIRRKHVVPLDRIRQLDYEKESAY